VSNLVELPFHEAASSTPLSRPENLARSAFHVSAGLVSLTLIRLLPSRGWLIAAAGAFALFAWTAETIRRRSPAANAKLMRFFGPVAHPHERHRTNSSTWYVTALTLLATLAPLPAAELAVLVLGFADPAAGAVGRRFGRTRIAESRTLEGSIGFVLVGAAVSLVWLSVTGVPLVRALVLGVVAGIAGALAEIASSKRFDDNFTIPVAVAALVSAALPFAQV
jgi:dolichol kinase